MLQKRLQRAHTVTWILIMISFLLVCALTVEIVRVQELRDRVYEQQLKTYEGCMRDNASRDDLRYLLTKDGAIERAENPAIAEQPCAQLYLGGSR